jgi:hypothetical protein
MFNLPVAPQIFPSLHLLPPQTLPLYPNHLHHTSGLCPRALLLLPYSPKPPHLDVSRVWTMNPSQKAELAARSKRETEDADALALALRARSLIPRINTDRLNHHQVIEYLNKKGYNKTEAMLRAESSNQESDGSMPNRPADADKVKYGIAFGK